MKERPILFNNAMVRAIIDGRKTQTRRVVKPHPERHHIADVGNMLGFKKKRGDGFWLWPNANDRILSECPYGQPGDRLWVRETCKADELSSGLDGVRYLADGAFIAIENSEQAGEKWGELACYGMKESGRPACRSVPSIHMPRWASRILLEIVSVRVERLQDISESDAIAEGIERDREHPTLWKRGNLHGDQNTVMVTGFPKLAYRSIWESINGPISWEANPWVWVVEFKRIAQ